MAILLLTSYGYIIVNSPQKRRQDRLEIRSLLPLTSKCRIRSWMQLANRSTWLSREARYSFRWVVDTWEE